jgi:hypothetical protein
MNGTPQELDLPAELADEPAPDQWRAPTWRLIEVRMSQLGQDTTNDGPDFTS